MITYFKKIKPKKMSVNTSLSLSEELNQSLDSSNLDISFNEREEEYTNIKQNKLLKKRKVSKISLRMEELKQKIKTIKELDDYSIEENDFYLDESSRCSKSSLKSNESSTKKENLFNKFDIYFTFKFNQKEFIISIESDVFNLNQNNVEDLVKNSIKKINEKNIFFQDNKINYILSLKDCDDYNEDFYRDNYELISYDKKIINYPFDLTLNEVKNQKIKLICKNTLNIMIRQF